jgi:hypothetical protein
VLVKEPTLKYNKQSDKKINKLITHSSLSSYIQPQVKKALKLIGILMKRFFLIKRERIKIQK